MRRIKKERQEFNPDNFKKGRLLVVKVPPFYEKEYLYEVSGAGGAVVRANLFHSPRVKKQWSLEDLELLFDSGMVRLAEDADIKRLQTDAASTESETGSGDDDDADASDSNESSAIAQDDFKRDTFY